MTQSRIRDKKLESMNTARKDVDNKPQQFHIHLRRFQREDKERGTKIGNREKKTQERI
jgi:hypothetical protein